MFVILSAGMLIITLASTLIRLPLGDFIMQVAPGLLNAVQGLVHGYLGLWAWELMFAPLLAQRIWVVPGFFTVLFALGAFAAWVRPPQSVSLKTS